MACTTPLSVGQSWRRWAGMFYGVSRKNTQLIAAPDGKPFWFHHGLRYYMTRAKLGLLHLHTSSGATPVIAGASGGGWYKHGTL